MGQSTIVSNISEYCALTPLILKQCFTGKVVPLTRWWLFIDTRPIRIRFIAIIFKPARFTGFQFGRGEQTLLQRACVF